MSRRKDTKVARYTRTKPRLLDDLHHLLNDNKFSPSFKFHHIRKDFLPSWTGIDENAENIAHMNNPFWSEDALTKLNENVEAGANDDREKLNELQHDHIVRILFFEEVLMDLVWKNKENKNLHVPKEALEFLFHHFGIGAMVTEHENQQKLDCVPYIVTRGKDKGQQKWKKKSHKWGMHLGFFDPTHPYYLNPWARYMDSNITMYKINHTTKQKEDLIYSDYAFDANKLSEREKNGYLYWKNIGTI
ncbi:hypothetical protein [Paenibacillus cremeus]|uniref:Uncharacterized protein n=1 Tax=Paenibacillus cremeus TaxID=2163881 RepID=A0A559K5G8_9BACL|nr:hypothetical protein [Paenibacillus cremeus]TVY07343.1 hypothetical protein FPZ49_24170 [Paenibacillus cremeus]